MPALYLIPTPVSENSCLDFWLKSHTKILCDLRDFVVEDLRHARRFLRQAGFLVPFEEVHFELLNVDTKNQESKRLLEPIFEGRSLGVFSEAGCPGIADPGSQLVKEAHQNGIRVIPLIGPSSVVLALMASGLNGQQFYFHGYLAKERAARQKQILVLQQQLLQTGATQIFIETPHRNAHLLEDLLTQLEPTTLLSLATDLTGVSEFIKTQTVQEWKNKPTLLEKRPTIFLMGI